MSTDGVLSAAQVRQFADHLREQEVPPAPLRFTLGMMPDGYTISHFDTDSLCLVPSGTPMDSTTVQGMCVAAGDPAHWSTPTTPVTVGGRTGVIAPVVRTRPDGRAPTGQDTTWHIQLQVDGGRALYAAGSMDPFVAMSRADFLRFVAAIAVPK